MEKFPKARVHHSSMSIFDHYLLMLLLKKKANPKTGQEKIFLRSHMDERRRVHGGGRKNLRSLLG